MFPSLLLYAAGIAFNGYMLFGLKSIRYSSTAIKALTGFQLFLNICNVLTHAGAEHSDSYIWSVLSAIFSFLSIYYLAVLLVLKIATEVSWDRSRQATLKTAFIIMVFIMPLLLTFFVRRYEVCGNGNCFAPKLGRTSNGIAVIRNSFVQLYLPTVILLFVSWYRAFRLLKEDRTEIKLAGGRRSRRTCRCLYSVSAILLFFIIYGVALVQYLLKTTADPIFSPNHLCMINCFYEELFVLLSMFPIHIRSSIMEEREKHLNVNASSHHASFVL